MSEKVVFLHRRPEPIAHYLRVGTSGHRQLETLLASGRLSSERVVIEGSAFARQQDLVGAFRDRGCELVLDTNVAELSSLGRYDGAVKAAPWALQGGVLEPGHFQAGGNHDVVRMIATFAVEHGFHAVQAPTHALERSTDAALKIDCTACSRLRRLLDEAGGKSIAIDYVLMTPYASVRDPAQRRAFVAALSDLPFENLWIRTSGFGSDASPIGVRRYIAAVKDFQRLNRPIVADGVGGLTALAIAAFGAAGGIAHGVAEKERFSTSGWHSPRPTGGGGRENRILVPGLDRLLSVKQMDVLMEAQGARRLLSCNDPTCCPRGWDDTRKDPKIHYLHQRAKELAALSRVPELRRARHFLDHDLAEADRTARRAAQLKVPDEDVASVLKRTSGRLDKMRAVLDDLQKTGGDAERASAPRRRFASKGDAAEGRSK